MHPSYFFLFYFSKDMAALNVGLNSTFDYQRQVINQLATEVYTINSGILTSPVGIGLTDPTSTLTVSGDIKVTGVTTSFGGFVSGLSTTAVQITVEGSQLLFTVVGIGTTSLTLL